MPNAALGRSSLNGRTLTSSASTVSGRPASVPLDVSVGVITSSEGIPQSYRVPAIDLGSNAMRYLIVEVSASGSYTVVDSEQLAVRPRTY